MSKDSTPTYLHLHAPHHADLFEEFCQPPSRTSDSSSSNNNPSSSAAAAAASSFATSTAHPNTTNDPSMVHVAGHFLPFEEIVLPPHLMPVNPEDEDGVVPDMHAAFGIQRALAMGEGHGQGGERREGAWRDLGLDRLMNGQGGGKSGLRREGKRGGILSVR